MQKREAKQRPSDEWLTIPELADWLKVPVYTVRKWNTTGTGPPRHRLGHRTVRYRRDEVEAWLADRAA